MREIAYDGSCLFIGQPHERIIGPRSAEFRGILPPVNEPFVLRYLDVVTPPQFPSRNRARAEESSTLTLRRGRAAGAGLDVAVHGLGGGGGGGREGAVSPSATEDEEQDRQREEEADQHQLRPHDGAAPPGSPLLVVVAVVTSPRAPRPLDVHIRIPTDSSIPLCPSSPLVLTRLCLCRFLSSSPPFEALCSALLGTGQPVGSYGDLK
jgi:hypothetical protein